MKYIENTALREWVKEELRVSIFQMAHKLSVQTGCEVLVKLQDSVDHSGCQYYATRTLNLQYMDKGLSKQPWEVMVSGVTGLPVSHLGVQSQNQNGSVIDEDAELSNDGTIEDSSSFPNHSSSLGETISRPRRVTRAVKHELIESEDASNSTENWTKLNNDSLPFPVAIESALVNQETRALDVLNQTNNMNDDQLQQHIYIYANTQGPVKEQGHDADRDDMEDPGDSPILNFVPSLNYKCTLCQKPFDTVAKLVKHAKSSHPGDETMRYHCVLCNREYKHARHLDQHTDLHNKASYRCATCCKGFYRSSTLREHELRDHQGRYRYYCPKCHKGFMRPSTMQAHLSRSHPLWFASKRVNPISISKSAAMQGISVLNILPNTDGEGTSGQVSETISEGEIQGSLIQGDQNNDGTTNTSNIQVVITNDAPKQTQKKMMKVVYQCKECGQMYDMANSLVRHIQDQHSKIKLRCNLCTYRTSRKSDLARHKRARHPVAIAPARAPQAIIQTAVLPQTVVVSQPSEPDKS
ncbi:uncharacterized protein [Asterias amurensis]|uniref:uncharacterized protein n=1 Tax=Asterias amurensis TaxID=7602 RepID=UPI003AB8D98C